MSLVLGIQPFSDVLDMHGEPDSSSAFSLSGHVVVSLTSPSSLFGRRKTTAHVVLQSLTITFEGQSEVLSHKTGYASVRLCSITRELLSSDPVDLSNERHEDSDKPCLWNVVFDIPVPGWLPTTSGYGDVSESTGTSYALYATATLVDINHNQSSSFFANICGPVRSRTRKVDAHRYPIILRRFVEPQPGSLSMFPMSAYFAAVRRTPGSGGSPRTSIPSDVLEKIQIVASIPSAIAMNETSIPFVLHVRGKGMNDSERAQLRITGFFVDVEQVEVYRTSPSRDSANYPIPPQRQQPPRVPLRNPHPIHTLYQTGFLGMFPPSVKRTFSLLESGSYVIPGGGHIFTDDQSSSPEDNWHTLETKIPIFAKPYLRDWAGARKRRITEGSPLFSVEHYVHVVVCCEYNLPDSGKPILERLRFSLPMRHVDVLKVTTPSSNPTENLHGDARKNIPLAQILPAYSQLFHSNGERKLDCSIPLPPYEPPLSCGLGSSFQRTL